MDPSSKKTLAETLAAPRGLPPSPPSLDASVLPLDADARAASAARALAAAVLSLDADALSVSLLAHVGNIPWKQKKAIDRVVQTKTPSDKDILRALLDKVSERVKLDFLSVSLASSVSAPVENSDWSDLSSVQRSDSGSTGVYFLNRSSPGGSSPSSPTGQVVCAKPMTVKGYDDVRFVDKLTTAVFFIRAPETRLIEKANPEFKAIEAKVRGLFAPMHLKMYDEGQTLKPLFDKESIMLMTFVKGSPLAPKGSLPRRLSPEDFTAIGKLFLLDLLLNNTDRLPCRRVMPRPGYVALEESGNPGNLIFGAESGELWSIDPEMVKVVDTKREEYVESICQVARELLGELHQKPTFKALDDLWYEPVAGLHGILDQPLQSLEKWKDLPPLQQDAIKQILSLIRFRASSPSDAALLASRFPNGVLVSPPSDSTENLWREWMRVASCRAVLDVQGFLSFHAGVTLDGSTFAAAFRRGFKQGMMDAFMFARRGSTFGDIAKLATTGEGKDLLETVEDSQVDCSFVIRLIRELDKCYNEHGPKKNFTRILKGVLEQRKASSASFDT